MAESRVYSKVNNLILITNHFPYGKGEAFLESEYPYLKSSFNKIVILTKNCTDTIRPQYSDTETFRISPQSSAGDLLIIITQAFLHFRKIISFLYDEYQRIKKEKGALPTAILRKAAHDLAKGLIRSYHMNKIIHDTKMEGNVFLYSYWLDTSSLGTLFVRSHKVNIIRFSRAHGGDIYETRHVNHYLSFRSVLLKNLNHIFAISENGKKHLFNQIKNEAGVQKKISVSRLGTFRKESIQKKPEGIFTIISCSYLLPVKRVNLLINALSYVHHKIRWIHIGDGPLFESLSKLANERLSLKSNIQFAFMGSMSNERLIRFYRETSAHLFINTSESEGIPVTIMEAQSFGIPVLAPLVGGIPEIINDRNGILFPPDISEKDLAGLVEKIISLPEEFYNTLRVNSYQNWKEKYNAEKNFPTFVDGVLSLANS